MEDETETGARDWRDTAGEQVINCMYDWEARKLAFDLMNAVAYTHHRVCHVDKQITIEGPKLVDPEELREIADRLGIAHIELDGTPIVWGH